MVQLDTLATSRRARSKFAHDAIERVVRIQLIKVEAAILAGVTQCRRQIETEPVNTNGIAPVGEQIDDQVLRDRVVGVEIAADPGVVPGKLHVGGQRIASPIVEPAEGVKVIDRLIGGVPRFALAGAVVNLIDEDLDGEVVEGLDHRLELACGARRAFGRVAAIQRKVVECSIAPVIDTRRGVGSHIVRVVLGFLNRFREGHDWLLESEPAHNET